MYTAHGMSRNVGVLGNRKRLLRQPSHDIIGVGDGYRHHARVDRQRHLLLQHHQRRLDQDQRNLQPAAHLRMHHKYA